MSLIVPIDKAFAEPRPPMLIEGFLPRLGSVIVASSTYVGKTFFALEAARAVAFGGQKFLGQYPAALGRVLFVECDSPPWDLAQQFDKVIGLPPEGLDPEEVENRYGGIRFIVDPKFSLNTHADADLLIAAVHADRWFQHEHTDGLVWTSTRPGFDLIVLDTLRAIHQYDENSNTEMQHVALLIRRVAEETDAAVMMLHHFNKSAGRDSDSPLTDRLRGASAFAGAVDGIFALSRKRGKEEVRVMVAKNRAAPHMRDFSYRQIDTPEGRTQLLVAPGGDTPRGELRAKILAAIQASKGEWIETKVLRQIAHQDVAAAPGPSLVSSVEAARKTVDRILDDLEREQVIQRTYGKARYAL